MLATELTLARSGAIDAALSGAQPFYGTDFTKPLLFLEDGQYYADQATAITFTRDVRINDHPLAKGSYSVWTIPRADMWTLIFNKAAKAYHDHYPGEGQDALRFDLRPEQNPHVETLTFSFPVVEGKDAVLRLEWGDVRVPLSLRVP